VAFYIQAYTSRNLHAGEVDAMKNIYVGNLDFQTTEEELRNLFGKHGKVERVSIPRDTATGKPRGFAFVEMQDDVEAERAIRTLNNSTLGSRTLKVNEARPKPGRAEPRGDGERRFGRG
jgi:RNA recognition motif-containing protein